MSLIGALTIGQSPRPDMMDDIKTILPKSVRIAEAGALDDLTDDEIKDLAPKAGDVVLITKLRSGAAVEVAERYIIPLLNKKFAELEASGAESTLLLCTDRFHGLSFSKPVIEPGPLLSANVPLLSRNSRIGVLVPEDSQIEQSKADWKPYIKDVYVLSASPYGDPNDIESAAAKLAEKAVDLIVLDCMGYTQSIKNMVQKTAKVPVVLPKMLAARVASETLPDETNDIQLQFIIPITADPEVIEQKFKDIAEYLRPYLDPATHVHYSNLNWGFRSVETELQGVFNGAQVVMKVHSETDGRRTRKDDGIFIDCFDDPGVYACRELGLVPTIGPYQAAVSTALNLAERIGIITTDEAGILNEEKKARAIGAADRIVSIRAVDLPVADIRTEKEKVLSDLVDACTKMWVEDRVTAVCLGCTAMFYIADDLKSRLRENKVDINVIEPILNGMLTLENMAKMKNNNYIPGGVDFYPVAWDQMENL